MSEFYLNLMVNGGEISSDISKLTADSVEYVTANFTFDESWNGLLKTAIFRRGETVYHTVLENDKCILPHEALSDGTLCISVFGVLGSKRATTTEVSIFIEKSGYVICEPSAPSNDPYAYFLEQATNLKNQSEEYAEKCQQAVNETEINKNLCETHKNESNATIKQVENYYNDTLILTRLVETSKNEIEISKDNVAALESSAKQYSDAALESYQKATSEVMNSIEAHNSEDNQIAHPQILRIANEAKSIAVGKAEALCFDTKEQMDLWIKGEFARDDGKTVNDLKTGDNLYILELDVPDFWWDGVSAQQLESEKPNFSDYYTKPEIDAKVSNALFAVISKTDYDNAYLHQTLDAGRIYFVYEEE